MAPTDMIGPVTGRKRDLAFATVLLAFVMDVTDSTILNTAIPAIQSGIGAGSAAVQWIVGGYFLAFGVLLVAGGRLGDLYGYRRLFVLGVGGFTVASALCGLAATPGQLIAARLLQGAMAAVMAPQVLALVQIMYDPVERIGRLAAFGLLGGLAAILGPVLGGFLIDLNPAGLGWRSIFFINLPIGIVAIVAGCMFLPRGRSPHPLRFDPVGTLLLIGAASAFFFALIGDHTTGWAWWRSGLILASAAMAFVFWRYEGRRERTTGSALIAPALFRERCFSLGLLTSLLYTTAATGFLLTFSLTLQRGLGRSPFEAAMLHLPFGIGVMAGISQIGRRALPRMGKRVPQVGAAAMAIGCAGIAAALFTGAPLPVLVPLLLVAGLGMGVLAGPLGPITLSRVDRGHAGVAGGTSKAVQQIGGALGAAIIGGIYFAATDGSSATAFPQAFLVAVAMVVALLLICIATLSKLPSAMFAPAPSTPKDRGLIA